MHTIKNLLLRSRGWPSDWASKIPGVSLKGPRQIGWRSSVHNSAAFLWTCNLGVTRGYKDGLQPETLADGNWLVKQNQPVSKIETKSDTNLKSLYESWFRNALISKSVILWWQVKKGINSELEGANTRRVLNIQQGKVRLHRFICLWWASERKLGKKPATCLNKSGSACMRLLFRALNLFLSWLVITVSLILRSMHS